MEKGTSVQVDWVDITTVGDHAYGKRRFMAINAKLPDKIQVCPTVRYLTLPVGDNILRRVGITDCWECLYQSCPRHIGFEG